MANCKECGRKTQVVQIEIIKTGKQKGWKKVKSRCELHGLQQNLVRSPLEGKEL